MKLLYKPLSLIGSSVAKSLGQSTFKSLWSRVDEGEPPKPTVHQTTLPKVVLAAALEAAVMAAVAAAADRGTAAAFQYLTGVWPGEETTEDE